MSSKHVPFQGEVCGSNGRTLITNPWNVCRKAEVRTLYLRRSTHLAHWAPVMGQRAALCKWQSGIATAVVGICQLLFFLSEAIGIRGHVGAFRIIGYVFLAGGIAGLYYARIALRRAYVELRRHKAEATAVGNPQPVALLTRAADPALPGRSGIWELTSTLALRTPGWLVRMDQRYERRHRPQPWASLAVCCLWLIVGVLWTIYGVGGREPGLIAASVVGYLLILAWRWRRFRRDLRRSRNLAGHGRGPGGILGP